MLAFAVHGRYVVQTSERTVRFGGFNVDISQFMQVDDDVASDRPSSSAISACFDRRGQIMLKTKNNDPTCKINKCTQIEGIYSLAHVLGVYWARYGPCNGDYISIEYS